MPRNTGRDLHESYALNMHDSERPDDVRPPRESVDALPVFGSSFKVYGDRWAEIRDRALALGILKDEQTEDVSPPITERQSTAALDRAVPIERPKPAGIALPLSEPKRSPIAAIGVETGG